MRRGNRALYLAKLDTRPGFAYFNVDRQTGEEELRNMPAKQIIKRFHPTEQAQLSNEEMWHTPSYYYLKHLQTVNKIRIQILLFFSVVWLGLIVYLVIRLIQRGGL